MSAIEFETTESVMREIWREVESARTKHPGNEHLLAALMEEVGELAKALLDCEPWHRVEAEAVQVACVAIRIATEGERHLGSAAAEEGSKARRC